MRNYLLLGTLFAFACGGKKTTPAQTTPEETYAAATSGSAGSSDPHLGYRKMFRNPGGMWLPRQMKLAAHADVFANLGGAMPAAQFADPLAAPLNAVVSLGGCTGSFVSPDGLIVTNHHCVQGSLQFLSTPENNLVENGFLAKTRAEEKFVGPAQRVTVATAFSDVTAKMRDGLEAITDPIKRKDEQENRSKALIAACEKDRPGTRCQVVSFFRGDEYQLIESLELRDIRLVYVPKRSIGNYGGEIDNWAWPRHTGDFSFYRAYVGPDGKPADYAENNVPFRPAHHLAVAAEGVRPHDLVMVTGYPGRTERLDTAATVRHDVEWTYPYMIQYYKERYAITQSMLEKGGDVAIKANVAQQGIQNALENNEGVLKGLTSTDLLKQKDEMDAAVRAWAAAPGREMFKAGIERLDALEAEMRNAARLDFDRAIAFGGSRLLATSLMLIRMAEERPKKDAARKPGFQDRDMSRLEAGQKSFARSFNAELDRANFRLALTRAAKLSEADRPWLALMLGTKKGEAITEALIDAKLDAMYTKTKLADEALRLQLLKKGTVGRLRATKDPFLMMALAIWPVVKAEEKKADARTGEMMLVSPYYGAAMRETMGGMLAPDANSTLRITYGTVRAIKPESTAEADWPFTTAAQIAKKDTGKDPFDAPKEQLDAIAAKKYGPYAMAELGGELPVNYITDLDITGGNSGSPTLNSKGELVGLAFDGTIEGVASDVVFRGDPGRTIHCDVRYMLWQMDAVDQADHLLTEMGIKPSL